MGLFTIIPSQLEVAMSNTTLLIAVVAVTAGIIGCESPTPVENRSLPPDDVLMKAVCYGVITIDEKIPFITIETNPVDIHPMAQVSGTVEYVLERPPILARDMVSVDLTVDATLHPLNGTEPNWNFHSVSTELVRISAKEPTIHSKEYTSRSAGWSVTLHIEYEVRKCYVVPKSIWAVRQPSLPPIPETL